MGKIALLKLENFTCFSELDLAFSNGVNVLIGVNGTGKTHILKVLYAACAISVGEGKDRSYQDKLCGVFSPYENDYRRLFRRPLARQSAARIVIDWDHGYGYELRWLSDTLDDRRKDNKAIYKIPGIESVYIPVKEMLAHAPGFVALTAKREIAFEEVYIDVIKQAYLPRLKILPNQTYEQIHKTLGKALGGKIILKGEHFFLRTRQGEIEFSLLAEGLRKVALIWLLIQNGSLNPGSILFWDEPEANLNPSLMGLVVETLLELQRQGVQVFLTTHNYVLLKEFDLRKKKDDAVQYISLFREADSDPVSVQCTNEYLAIDPNAIAGTFSDLYKRDISRALQGSK